jgi:hypothetical protein
MNYVVANSQAQILSRIQIFTESTPLQGGLSHVYGNVSARRAVQVTLAHERKNILLFSTFAEAAAAAKEAFGWQGKVVAVTGCSDSKIIDTPKGPTVQ